LSKYLGGLKVLSLNHNKIANEGFNYLLISDVFDGLQKLHITYNSIQEDGAMSLTNSKWFTGIEHLDIQENELGNIGAQILSSISMKNLKFLNIRHNNIGDQGYKCLSEGDKMPLLQTLYIYPGNNASMEAKKSLIRSKTLKSLNNVC
jgi:hypothetical protein